MLCKRQQTPRCTGKSCIENRALFYDGIYEITHGSFVSSCEVGYDVQESTAPPRFTGKQCVESSAMCYDGICENTHGSFVYSCGVGYSVQETTATPRCTGK